MILISAVIAKFTAVTVKFHIREGTNLRCEKLSYMWMF